MKRLDAITAQLGSLDFSTTGHGEEGGPNHAVFTAEFLPAWRDDRGAGTRYRWMWTPRDDRPSDGEWPAHSGHDVVAHAAPLRVRAYELRFSDASEADVQARRAALVVEFAGSDGYARGFVEWGRADEPPSTYLADGWARQRESVASPLTVFELALHFVEAPGSQGPTAVRGRPTPLAVRVVVDEATGDATLTRER